MLISTLHIKPKDLFPWSALEPIPERVWRPRELAGRRLQQPTGGPGRAEQKMDSPGCACP